jgi:hypothetical protein
MPARTRSGWRLERAAILAPTQGKYPVRDRRPPVAEPVGFPAVPLSEDQRAMLQLLLERDQSYEDIGSLLGLGVDEVRSRAREALTEIGGENPDRQVALTDYLLGQADPIGRADVARHLQSDSESRALAEKLLAQLRLLAPGADLPALPATKAGAREPKPPAAEPAAPTAASPGGLSTLSGRQRRLIAALLGGGALVVVIVLLVAGVFSGDGDDDGGGGASNGDQQGTTAANQEEGELTRAILEPVGGGDAQGVAFFGRIRNVPVLEVRAEGLEPSSGQENYMIWLYRSDRVALRVGEIDRVGEAGRIVAQIPIPAQALGFVANGTFGSIVVSLTNTRQFDNEVERARGERRLPQFTGRAVLRGEITGPAVEQAAGGAGGGGQGGGQAGGG